MRFSLPIVTSWKQPSNLRLIAAVKKIYKFLILKDVLSFYELNNDNQKLLKEEVYKCRKRFIGVCYGRLATLLDAANYAKEAWDKVTDETIKNAFIKADLRISLDNAVTETFDNDKFLKLFKNINITATEQDIDEFVTIDDESSHVFQEEILEEANRFFEEQQTVNEDENITSDEDEPVAVGITSQRLQASNILDDFYAKSVIMGGELSSAEMQAAVGNNYGKLQSAFDNFQKMLKKICQQQKESARPKRQATLTDMFSRASSSK